MSTLLQKKISKPVCHHPRKCVLQDAPSSPTADWKWINSWIYILPECPWGISTNRTRRHVKDSFFIFVWSLYIINSQAQKKDSGKNILNIQKQLFQLHTSCREPRRNSDEERPIFRSLDNKAYSILWYLVSFPSCLGCGNKLTGMSWSA